MKDAFYIPFSRNWLAQIVGLAGLYVGATLLGSFVAVAQGKVLASWPAAGLAIAAVWWGGFRLAPAIGLGTFLYLQLTRAPVSTSVGIAIGNSLEPILAAYLMRRCVGGPRLFDRVRQVFRYFLQVGLVATAPGAALGATSLCLGAAAQWEAFPSLFPLWWATDAMGAFVAAPFLLAWTRPSRLTWTVREWGEAGVAFAALTLGCLFVFGEQKALFGIGFPAAFPVLPIIVWIAVRFDQRAAVSAILMACVFAIWGTLRGRGPFVETAMPLMLLHFYVDIVALTALVLGAIVAEHKETEKLVRESEARKAAILETAFDAIVSMDHTGKVHEWNLAAERMFG